MIKKLDWDEMYPVFYFADDGDEYAATEIEVDSSQIEWVRRVSWEFQKVQDFLRKKSNYDD